MFTMLAVVTTTMAATAIISVATAIAARGAIAAVTTMTSNSRILTADEGDAQDRDEDRDTEKQCTIHSSNPPKKYRNVRSKLCRTTLAPQIVTAPIRAGNSNQCCHPVTQLARPLWLP